MKWHGHPNLARRPPTPSKGRGPVQRLARRALLAGGGTATTSQVLDWVGRHRDFALPGWQGYGKLHVILEQIGAERTHRDWSKQGAPWVWRLRNSDDPNDTETG